MTARRVGRKDSKISRFAAETKKIAELLGLKWAPIAGTFSVGSEELGDPSRKLSVCEAFSAARRDNVVLKLSKKNCTCSGGRHFTGLEPLPVRVIATAVTSKEHRIYESMDAAVASIRQQPQPVKRGDSFVLGPLEEFTVDPDMVFLFVTPA